MSAILSQDITSLQNLDRSSLSARDLDILRVWDNDTWQLNCEPVEQCFMLLPHDCIFQIMIVENISRSKLQQLDDMDNKLDPTKQRVDRIQKSKVVINEVNVESGAEMRSELPFSKDVYKLTLQDKRGRLFYATNSNYLAWIGACVLGSKLIIKKDAPFSRGVFIIKDSDCTFLGGINRIWNEDKESKLYNYLESKLNRDHEQISVNGKRRR